MKGEAVALLAKCRAHGISLRPGEGGRLKVSPPPERLPGEIVEEIKRHKGEILVLLKAEPTQQLKSPAASHPLYEEMVRQLPEDFPLLNAWMAEVHPVLWQQIRDLDAELRCSEHEHVSESNYQVKLDQLRSLYHEAKALREGRWGALLVKSALLGREVWILKDRTALSLIPDDARLIFFAEEIEVLKGKDPEQIQDILTAQAEFPGCRVVQ